MAEVGTKLKDEQVAIVGSGMIGRSWAMLFAGGGYKVTLYDVDQQQVQSGLDAIREQLTTLEKQELLRGTLTAEQQYSRISGTDSLKSCIQGAVFVQECVPEDLILKRQIFEEFDKIIGESCTILSSSTSCLPGSTISENLQHRSRVIVSHPINPPLFCPLVEIVPTPWTDPDVTTFTLDIMKEIGQSPVLLKKEMPGFAVNRIQYALLNECWRLIQDGVMSSEDIDKVMTDGLGMRYAFIGPMETCHLNADGFKDYCNRFGDSIHKVSSTFGPLPKMEGATMEQISSELEQKVPLDNLAERRKWRDARLIALSQVKKKMDHKE